MRAYDNNHVNYIKGDKDDYKLIFPISERDLHFESLSDVSDVQGYTVPEKKSDFRSVYKYMDEYLKNLTEDAVIQTHIVDKETGEISDEPRFKYYVKAKKNSPVPYEFKYVDEKEPRYGDAKKMSA